MILTAFAGEQVLSYTSIRGVAWLLGLTAGAFAQSGTLSRITSYAVPTNNSQPSGIVTGPDGALWFAESNGGAIGRITTSGVITEYRVMGSLPNGITTGPDGALWFADASNHIGRITTSGAVTRYPIPTASSFPSGIVTGPDGALWFTEYRGGKIGRVTTSGAITEYPTPSSGSGPTGITSRPGGLWFTEFNTGYIGYITTSGAITEFAVPTPLSQPDGITAGPDNAAWFVEYGAGKIGRITNTGVVTEYPLPLLSGPVGITTGPDGALWFTNYTYDGGIGRITTSGVITNYPVQSTKTEPNVIVTGPDGNLWFTEFAGDTIANAPACGLALSPSFSNGVLTLNFDLGITIPAVLGIVLKSSTATKYFSMPIPAIVPPQPVTKTFNSISNVGNLTVFTGLGLSQSGPGICAEWNTVNTAAQR